MKHCGGKVLERFCTVSLLVIAIFKSVGDNKNMFPSERNEVNVGSSLCILLPGCAGRVLSFM